MMYVVGNQVIKDKWLENLQSAIDYHFLTNKSFDLLDAQARLQEIDKDDLTKINQTIKEIEFINKNDDPQEEEIKQENLINQLQEEIFDEAKNVTFYKKSKILGKPLVRFANITRQFIRIIYHSKITHDQYIYQVEKRSQDSVIQVKTSNKSVQNQIKYKNEVVRQFQGAIITQGNEPELSQLKWIEMHEYNYRIIMRSNPGSSHKFEYAIYLHNEKEVKQALNTIRISQAVHQQQSLPLNCLGDIHYLFEKISMKWKSCVASQLKKQMDNYNSINKQFKSINQQNYTTNTSYSQDYYNNRNSKPIQYRNNYSVNENQISNFISELQGTKDNNNQDMKKYNISEQERIVRELMGSSIIQNNSEIQQKQTKGILKKGSTTEEFDSNIFLMTPNQKDKSGKSEDFENYLKLSAKPTVKGGSSDTSLKNQQSQQNKLKQPQELEGLPFPIIKQNDQDLISDESMNLDFLDQKKGNQEEAKEIYNSYSNDEKSIQRGSQFYNPNIISNILNPNNSNNKSLAFYLNERSQTSRQNQSDGSINQQKTNQSKNNESNKNSSSSPGIQSADSNNYNQNEQFRLTQSIATSYNQNTGRSDLQAPLNSIAFSSVQNSLEIENRQNNQQFYSQANDRQQSDQKEKPNQEQKENESRKVEYSQEDNKNQYPSIMSQLIGNTAQPITLDPLLEEPEITSIGSITPQNSYQKLQNSQNQKHNSKNNYNSLQSQKGKESFQTQFLQENMMKSFGESNHKQNSEGQRSKQNSMQIFDYINQQKPGSQRSLSVSSNAGQKQQQQTQQQENLIQSNTNPTKISVQLPNSQANKQVLEGERNQNDSFTRYQMEEKYQKESAILSNYKKKSLLGEDAEKAIIQESVQLQQNQEQKSSDRQQETRKHENQDMISDRSSILEQQKKKEQMLEYINMNRESIVQSQKETQFNNSNFDNSVSIFLQKLEMISPITDYPPEIQVEMYLYNVNTQQIVVQSEWKQFKKPIEKIEDNFIYEVEESYKEVIFQISKSENYEVHLFIKTKFNSKIIGTIASKLTDILDYENPGKDFWLICPINYPNIPLAIINIWSSSHENCDNYRENIYQLYSQINTIKNPLYKSYINFPEIRQKKEIITKTCFQFI